MVHLKKGSPEAKAYMAKLRAMRGKGSYTNAALKGGSSYNKAALKGGIAPELIGAAASILPTVGSMVVKGISSLIARKKAKKAAKKAKAREALMKAIPEIRAKMEERKGKMSAALQRMQEASAMM